LIAVNPDPAVFKLEDEIRVVKTENPRWYFCASIIKTQQVPVSYRYLLILAHQENIYWIVAGSQKNVRMPGGVAESK
jgi:hypothetical protein